MFIYRIKMYMLLRIRCCIKILPNYSDITLFQVGSMLLIFKWFFLCFSSVQCSVGHCYIVCPSIFGFCHPLDIFNVFVYTHSLLILPGELHINLPNVNGIIIENIILFLLLKLIFKNSLLMYYQSSRISSAEQLVLLY